MVAASVYVGIAIACVVALLVLVVLIIYCVKREQDKWNDRMMRERRRREERQRRNFQRAQMVHPPSYEVSRVLQQPRQPNREIPWSPPPEYKELATPIPGQRSNQTVGIGGVYDTDYYPPHYSEISSVSRNVAPVYTYLPPGVPVLANNTAQIVYNSNTNSSSTNTNNNSSNNNNNRRLQINRSNSSAYRSDNAIQVQVTPRSVLPDVVTSARPTGGNGNSGPISLIHRTQDGANLSRPTNILSSSSSSQINSRSTVDTTSLPNAGSQNSGLPQNPNAPVRSRSGARTPHRSSSRSGIGRHSDATGSSVGASEPNPAATNQIPSQFQDLSLI